MRLGPPWPSWRYMGYSSEKVFMDRPPEHMRVGFQAGFSPLTMRALRVVVAVVVRRPPSPPPGPAEAGRRRRATAFVAATGRLHPPSWSAEGGFMAGTGNGARCPLRRGGPDDSATTSPPPPPSPLAAPPCCCLFSSAAATTVVVVAGGMQPAVVSAAWQAVHAPQSKWTAMRPDGVSGSCDEETAAF